MWLPWRFVGYLGACVLWTVCGVACRNPQGVAPLRPASGDGAVVGGPGVASQKEEGSDGDAGAKASRGLCSSEVMAEIEGLVPARPRGEAVGLRLEGEDEGSGEELKNQIDTVVYGQGTRAYAVARLQVGMHSKFDYVRWRACPEGGGASPLCVEGEATFKQTELPHLPAGKLRIEAWPCLDPERAGPVATGCLKSSSADPKACLCGLKTELSYEQKDNSRADPELKQLLWAQYQLDGEFDQVGQDMTRALAATSSEAGSLQLAAQGPEDPSLSQAKQIEQALSTAYGPRFYGRLLRDHYETVRSYLQDTAQVMTNPQMTHPQVSESLHLATTSRGTKELCLPSSPTPPTPMMASDSSSLLSDDPTDPDGVFVDTSPTTLTPGGSSSSNALQTSTLVDGGRERENLPSKQVLIAAGIGSLVVGIALVANGYQFHLGKGLRWHHMGLFKESVTEYRSALSALKTELRDLNTVNPESAKAAIKRLEKSVKGSGYFFNHFFFTTHKAGAHRAFQVKMEHNPTFNSYLKRLEDLHTVIADAQALTKGSTEIKLNHANFLPYGSLNTDVDALQKSKSSAFDFDRVDNMKLGGYRQMMIGGAMVVAAGVMAYWYTNHEAYGLAQGTDQYTQIETHVKELLEKERRVKKALATRLRALGGR